MSDFKVLISQRIASILIGDDNKSAFDELGMPYLSENNIYAIANKFKSSLLANLTVTSGRRNIMLGLLNELEKNRELEDFINYILSSAHYCEFCKDNNDATNKEKYNLSLINTLSKINNCLSMATPPMKLTYENGKAVLMSLDAPQIISTETISKINYEYISSLTKRIQEDLNSKDYDSVITKSRTLIEEVCVYIIERIGGGAIKNTGKILNLYGEVEKILNLQTDPRYDKRINQLLSGLTSIINSVASLRNIGSDAHGVGSKRYNIQRSEAMLIANATITLCTYLLEKYEQKKNSEPKSK